jgi:hypothetical protein
MTGLGVDGGTAETEAWGLAVTLVAALHLRRLRKSRRRRPTEFREWQTTAVCEPERTSVTGGELLESMSIAVGLCVFFGCIGLLAKPR